MRIVSEAYQHLGAKLLAEVLDDHQRPALHHADLWYEQTDFPEVAEAIDYPAVFFDFAADTLSSMGQLEQDVKLNTDLYVAVDTLASTAIGTTDAERADGLHYLELCARVHELLHGYEHASCGNLSRVGFVRHSARTNLIVYRLTYASDLVDASATEASRPTKPGTGGPSPVFHM
jgi:hypothetical protein